MSAFEHPSPPPLPAPSPFLFFPPIQFYLEAKAEVIVDLPV